MQGISSKGMYALSAMHTLLHSPNLQSMQAKEMAVMIDVSAAYLEQILSKLKKAGILNSLRGSKGGFVFAKNIEDIMVIDILLAVDEKSFSFKEYGQQSKVINAFWQDMHRKMKELFNVKLTELDKSYIPLMYEI